MGWGQDGEGGPRPARATEGARESVQVENRDTSAGPALSSENSTTCSGLPCSPLPAPAAFLLCP